MDQTIWLNPILPVAAVEGDEVEVLGTKPLVERGTTAKKITVGFSFTKSTGLIFFLKLSPVFEFMTFSIQKYNYVFLI